MSLNVLSPSKLAPNVKRATAIAAAILMLGAPNAAQASTPLRIVSPAPVCKGIVNIPAAQRQELI